jgi:hypothetical protein
MALPEPALLLVCSACGRRFAVVGDPGAEGPSPCACGGELVEEAPPSGVYELRAPKEHKKGRGIPREPDLGYGESHGYGPAHGGPTGPGDAPAPASERPHRSPPNRHE